MNVRLTKVFRFEAAHLLPRAPVGHKCRNLHGHSFKVELAVQGRVHEDEGWFIDYAALDEAWRPLHELLDHRYLNEVPGLDNPTSEHLARWIWVRLSGALPLARVTVHETCNARCEYEGN